MLPLGTWQLASMVGQALGPPHSTLCFWDCAESCLPQDSCASILLPNQAQLAKCPVTNLMHAAAGQACQTLCTLCCWHMPSRCLRESAAGHRHLLLNA